MLRPLHLSLTMASALVVASPAPDLMAPAPGAGDAGQTALPFHLFNETLRVPFGGDWGGETFLFTDLGHRLSLGLFMRAWSEALCVTPSCDGRALEGGVELRYQVKPGVDIGVDVGAQRGGGVRSVPGVMPRVRVKF